MAFDRFSASTGECVREAHRLSETALIYFDSGAYLTAAGLYEEAGACLRRADELRAAFGPAARSQAVA